MTSDRRFIIDSLADSAFIEKRRIAQIVIWPKVTHIKDTVILAYPHWAVNNYYHWLLEFLPRISPVISPSAYSGFEADLSQAKILIPPNPFPWVSETLEILGVKQEQLLVANENQLQVDDLIFLSRVGKPMNTPIWAIHWLRDHMKSHISQQQSIKRILISRKKAAKRRVVNDYQVEKALEAFDFCSVTLEELSVVDQIALFSQAETVVAPHGAGLANIVFADHITVVEILEPSWLHPTFYALSHDCGHRYCYLLGDTCENGNIYVDIPKLLHTVEVVLSKDRES
jgi:capsular polysaccharide biosynthesis protein